jgi:hypothetical protein
MSYLKLRLIDTTLNWLQKLSTQKERVGLDDGVWSGFSWLREGKVVGPFKHGNKTLGSIKC